LRKWFHEYNYEVPLITSRQRVLNYLKNQRSASAAQIGRGLNMSAANVRHHLSIMLRDGRIALINQKRRDGRGRPVKLYGLSDAILGELLNGLSPVKRDGMLNEIAKTLAVQFEANNLNIPMTKRLAIIVDKLNELHYQARWEAGPQGPRILFAHCPYAAIIERHPELCRMDEILLGNLMNAKACQLAKIGQQPIGSPYCVFEI